MKKTIIVLALVAISLVMFTSCDDAVKNYSVTFDANGGTFQGLDSTIEQTFGSKYKIPEADPTRDGYTFAGWYKGTNKIESTTTVDITSNITLTAKWTAKTYQVTFDTDDAIETTAPLSVTYDSTYGTLPTVTKTGYTFDGWYKGTSKIESTTTVDITSDITLTAKWTPKTCNVTFDANDGTFTGSDSVIEQTFGSKYKIPAADPTRTNYVFKGWYTKDNADNATTDLGTKINSTIDVVITEAKTYYALWEDVKYQVTFDANGGTFTGSDSVIGQTDGSKYKIPAADPTRTNYVFKGWYTIANLDDVTSPAGTKIDDTVDVNITEAKTYYALWKTDYEAIYTIIKAAFDEKLAPDWDDANVFTITPKTGTSSIDSRELIADKTDTNGTIITRYKHYWTSFPNVDCDATIDGRDFQFRHSGFGTTINGEPIGNKIDLCVPIATP